MTIRLVDADRRLVTLARHRRVADRDEPAGLDRDDLEGALDRVAQLAGGPGRPGRRLAVGRQEADQPGAPLEWVVEELGGEVRLLGQDDLVDRGRPVALGRGGMPGRALRLVLAERLVIRLGAPAHDRAQGVSNGPDVPAADRGAIGQVDRDDLSRAGQPDVVEPIEVEIAALGGLELAGRPVGQVLGRDEVLVGREPHVADVDAAEQPVPVAVVRLALVEVVERPLPLRSGRHGVHLGRGPEHLLVEVVDLAVLDLEVAPERAAQPARLRPVVLLRRHGARS